MTDGEWDKQTVRSLYSLVAKLGVKWEQMIDLTRSWSVYLFCFLPYLYVYVMKGNSASSSYVEKERENLADHLGNNYLQYDPFLTIATCQNFLVYILCTYCIGKNSIFLFLVATVYKYFISTRRLARMMYLLYICILNCTDLRRCKKFFFNVLCLVRLWNKTATL